MSEPSEQNQTIVAPRSRRVLLGAGISGAIGVGLALVTGSRANAVVRPVIPRITPPGPTLPIAAGSASAASATAALATPVLETPTLSTTTPITGRPAVRAIAMRPGALGGPADRDASVATSTPNPTSRLTQGKQYATYSAAAAAAKPLLSPLFTPTDSQGHLLRRATFGARPSDVANLKKLGIDAWLTAQLSPATMPDPAGDAAWSAFPLAGATPATIVAKTVQFSWDAMLATGQATLGRQMFSDRQLYEIVVDIFAAHLHVPLPGEQWHIAPDYITNVIRKYAFGKYRDMLHASMKHPAMLNFLSNDQSDKAHVNENLGRELLELHTVGLIYSENDVQASAAILSGRTINWDAGSYVWDGGRHVVGPQTVLGFSTANATEAGGEAVGDAYITYLANHRATALTIARKIATRFVSDEPSASLLGRLADVYIASDTSIIEVVKAVFRSSDFWSAVGVRMRRPLEDAVGAARVLDIGLGATSAKTATGVTNLYWNLWNAGNNPLGWDPPNGYPDVAAAWLGAGSMIQRWNVHRGLVYGWGASLTYVAPLKLVPLSAKMTFGQWVDAVSVRLIGKTLTANHRAAVLAGIGHAASDVLPTWNWTWNGAGEGISLILDSAYFQLR